MARFIGDGRERCLVKIDHITEFESSAVRSKFGRPIPSGAYRGGSCLGRTVDFRILPQPRCGLCPARRTGRCVLRTRPSVEINFSYQPNSDRRISTGRRHVLWDYGQFSARYRRCRENGKWLGSSCSRPTLRRSCAPPQRSQAKPPGPRKKRSQKAEPGRFLNAHAAPLTPCIPRACPCKPLLCRRVGDHLKKQGLSNVSNDTILRAAGRRK
jgi:hypothetical protein